MRLCQEGPGWEILGEREGGRRPTPHPPRASPKRARGDRWWFAVSAIILIQGCSFQAMEGKEAFPPRNLHIIIASRGVVVEGITSFSLQENTVICLEHLRLGIVAMQTLTQQWWGEE